MRESWCRRKGHWEEVDNSQCVTPAVRRHPSSLPYQHILIACTGTSGGKASLVACEQCSPTQAPPTAVTFPRDPMSPLPRGHTLPSPDSGSRGDSAQALLVLLSPLFSSDHSSSPRLPACSSCSHFSVFALRFVPAVNVSFTFKPI